MTTIQMTTIHTGGVTTIAETNPITVDPWQIHYTVTTNKQKKQTNRNVDDIMQLNLPKPTYNAITFEYDFAYFRNTRFE